MKATFKTGHMAKLVDALDLGSSGETHQSSNLCMPTKTSVFLIYRVTAWKRRIWSLQVGLYTAGRYGEHRNK